MANVKYVNVKGFGNRPVAPKSLEDALISDGMYVSDEARDIDTNIFFYIEDSVFNRYTDRELGEYVARMVA